MATGEVGGRAVGLGELLRAREERAARQAALLARHGRPLLSATLVMPGPVKDGPRLRALMDRSEGALAAATARAGYAILERERIDGPTGPELFLAVDCAALELKRLAVSVEEGEPWGRLLDADVVSGLSGEVGDASALPVHVRREEVGCAPRRCLACGEDAAACMAARRHAAAELAAAVARLLDDAG